MWGGEHDARKKGRMRDDEERADGPAACGDGSGAFGTGMRDPDEGVAGRELSAHGG